jgi:alkylation response protein AidB-like acyl-CoA dehydrogenase
MGGPKAAAEPHMDFNLSDEQQMLRDGAQRYLAEHYAFEARKGLLASAAGFSQEQWRQFADLGWLATGLPEDVGGLGFSFIETTLIAEEMGRRLVVEPFASTAILGARLVDRSGNAAIRMELLPLVAQGSLRLALAHGESPSRYDRSRVATQARRAGDGYEIQGRKLMCFDAPSADKLIVSAVLDGSDGFALFLVDRAAAGVTLESYPLIDDTRAADIRFDSVRLASSALLVPSQRGFDVLDDALDRLLLARVAEALGGMERVLDLTRDHLKNRAQFGQPLGRFQALQHRMAEMFVEVQETRSILFRGLAYIDAPAEERRAAVAAARIVAIAAGRVVGGQGIQLHGGVGMTEEYEVGHYFKRLLVLEKAYGDCEYHLQQLARASR